MDSVSDGFKHMMSDIIQEEIWTTAQRSMESEKLLREKEMNNVGCRQRCRWLTGNALMIEPGEVVQQMNKRSKNRSLWNSTIEMS